MKIRIIIFFMFCILQNNFCQVSGKLTTAKGQPVPFANILLLNVDSSLVRATLTNEKGIYQFENIRPGKYILRYSSVGYQGWDSPLFELVYGDNKDFGIQIMKEDNKQLDEVIVRAEKPLYQQQPGGTIINVESSILTKGSSALQVLERSPGVILDYRNNSISLNGKNGVMVMIDGKLMRMTMEQVVSLLNGMSADDIEKIELLTTPPARYDAEGNAGLINIVLKKNKKPGTNGAVSLTGGYGMGEKGTGSLNLGHNNGTINLYGSYTFSHNRTYSDMFITSSQNMPFLGGSVYVLFWDTTRSVQDNYEATFGLDIKLNSKTTIGANFIYNSSNASTHTINNAGYNVLPDSLLQFNGNNKGNNNWRNLVNSIYLEKIIRQGEKISFDADYLYFNNDNPYEVQSSFINKHGMQAGTEENLFSPRQKGFANTTIQVGVGKMDYSKQLSKKINVETGIKGTYTNSASSSGIQSWVNNEWVSSDQTSNNIVMKEGIGAAYASANWQINSSANLTVGIRYEYSSTNMDNSKTGESIAERKLGTFFPNIFFSKKINDRSGLQLSYTKRISRPSYNDLASYVGYSDPTAVYTGNPFLKPTITHNIKLGYNYNGYTFSILFSRDINAISRYQLTESAARDMLLISPQNLTWQNYITFQTNLPWKVNEWWNMSYGFVGGLRQYRVDYSLHPFVNKYFGYTLNFSQAFKLPKSFTAEISGLYNSFFYNGTQKIDGYGVLNLGIKKELKNNGGSFQFSIANILRGERINVSYGTITEEAFNIKSHVAITMESAKFPVIKLTYSRSFGSGSMKIQRKQGTGSEDERDRIRKD